MKRGNPGSTTDVGGPKVWGSFSELNIAGISLEGATVQDIWLDADQTAQSLHITKATLYKLIRKGRVPATKVHGKWRFTREEIEELFESSKFWPASRNSP
jgi:excisionase family DNA binding protein